MLSTRRAPEGYRAARQARYRIRPVPPGPGTTRTNLGSVAGARPLEGPAVAHPARRVAPPRHWQTSALSCQETVDGLWRRRSWRAAELAAWSAGQSGNLATRAASSTVEQQTFNPWDCQGLSPAHPAWPAETCSASVYCGHGLLVGR